MNLKHWKFEIVQDAGTGRFCVRDLSIETGRKHGGGVAVRTLFESDSFEDCAAYCRNHNIKTYEIRG